MVRWKCFVPQLYQFRRGISVGPALQCFYMIHRGGRLSRWIHPHQRCMYDWFVLQSVAVIDLCCRVLQCLLCISLTEFIHINGAHINDLCCSVLQWLQWLLCVSPNEFIHIKVHIYERCSSSSSTALLSTFKIATMGWLRLVGSIKS